MGWPKALDFDGTNDYLTLATDLTGNANGKVGTVSVWFRLDGSDGTSRYFISNASIFFSFGINTSNKIGIHGENTSGSKILSFSSSATYTADSSTWHHAMASWDLANTTTHLYVDEVDVNVEDTATNDTIDYTKGSWGIGAAPAGGAKYNGRLSDLYFSQEYIDLSTQANRWKLRNRIKKPVYLGDDGSNPTGNQPIIYMDFQTSGQNLGSSGDSFTVVGSPTSVDGPPMYNPEAKTFTSNPHEERWVDCDRCGFTFRISDTMVEEHTGRRVCTTGPNCWDPDPDSDPGNRALPSLVDFPRFFKGE
jgi:hypothetical protein